LNVRSAILAAVLIPAILALGLPAPGLANPESVSRLQWGTARVAWHDACTFSHEAGEAPDHGTRHRFAVIQGNLRSMAREDAALYAVFLESSQDIQDLRDRLAVETPHDLRADASRTFCCEWLPLAANGHLTLFVDEAHQTGKTVVAIVNGKGEILGTHPLWTGSDLAAHAG
jgi:hypothetical protein